MITVLLLIGAGASFFFALAETALFSLGKWKAQELAVEGGWRGSLVLRLLQEPQDLLATTVLGNTFANGGLIATALWTTEGTLWYRMVLMAGLLLLILTFCEVIPKTIAVRNPRFWSLRVAWQMRVLVILATPLREVAQRLNRGILRVVTPRSLQTQAVMTEHEYQEVIEMAFQQGTLGESEKEIILQIINLDRRTVREVMKPRAQMAAIQDDLPVEEMRNEVRRLQHSRIPLYDETPDTIVGILNTRTFLLEPNVDLGDAIEFPSFVPDTMNLLQLLRSLQKQQRGMAIVMDEFGGTAGIVTMEDIIAEMIGQFRAEEDHFFIETVAPGKWRVSGTMRVEDFRREYPALTPIPEVDTMGGLLVHKLEIVPQQGQSIILEGLKLTAQSADDRRVREILVETVKKGTA